MRELWDVVMWVDAMNMGQWMVRFFVAVVFGLLTIVVDAAWRPPTGSFADGIKTLVLVPAYLLLWAAYAVLLSVFLAHVSAGGLRLLFSIGG